MKKSFPTTKFPCSFPTTGEHAYSRLRTLGKGNRFGVKPGTWCLDCGWLQPLPESRPGPSLLAKRF